MAVKISQLSASAPITSDDFFPVVDSGSLTTLRASAQQILNYVTGSTFNTLTVNNLTSSTATFTTITASQQLIQGDLRVLGTASIGQLNTVNQTSLVIGDKYITILSGGVDHTGINGSGFLWGTSSGPGETTGALGEHAHVLYDASRDALEIFPGLYVTGSTTVFDISGTTAQFTNITANSISASSYQGIALISPGGQNTSVQFNSGSQFSGSANLIYDYTNNILSGTTAQFTAITSSDLVVTGGFILMHEPIDLGDRIGDNAYVLYNSAIDKLAAFPGLYVTGAITASTSLSASNIGATTAVFSVISASIISASSYVGPIGGGSGTPGGTNQTIQFNSGSTFSGSTSLVYNYVTNVLSGTKSEFITITASNIIIPGTNSADSALKVGSLEFQPYSVNNAWIGENTYFDGSKFVRRQTGAAGMFYFNGNEGQFRFVTSSAAGTELTNFGNIQFKVNASGTVGLGGSITYVNGDYTGATLFVSPSGSVINGILNVISSLTASSGYFSGTPISDGDNRVLLQAIDTNAMTAGVGAGFTFGGKFNTSGDIAGFAGIKGIKENSTDGNLDTALVLMTRKNGVGSIAEKMRITSDGYVGIGTSTPSERLHVSNTGSVYTLIENTTNSGYSSVQVKNDTGSYVQLVSVGTATAGIWFGGDTSPLNRANTVGFRTGGSESALLFAAQGNVPLHIGQNDTTRLLINASSASFNNNKLNYDFRVAGVSDDNVMFVKASSDSVGIGTSSPNAKLDVNGNVTITGSLTTTNTNSSIAFSASNSSYWTGSPPATLQEALNRIAEAIYNGITGSIA